MNCTCRCIKEMLFKRSQLTQLFEGNSTCRAGRVTCEYTGTLELHESTQADLCYMGEHGQTYVTLEYTGGLRYTRVHGQSCVTREYMGRLALHASARAELRYTRVHGQTCVTRKYTDSLALHGSTRAELRDVSEPRTPAWGWHIKRKKWRCQTASHTSSV